MSDDHGRLTACLVSIACFLRGVPLFFCATPRTPLRVLCIIAFDTLHVLRTSRPLPRHRVRQLAALLDFGACANSVMDHKQLEPGEFQMTRQRLEIAGISPVVEHYLRQLQELEGERPSPGGDDHRFDDIRAYRQAIAKIWLRMIATIAFNPTSTEDGTWSIQWDDDLEMLFRIVMQCQIIDDVLDYAEDDSAGLPSFLTASLSLPHSLHRTAQAARSYGSHSDLSQSADLFPLRAAVVAVSGLAQLVIRIRVSRASGTSRMKPA